MYRELAEVPDDAHFGDQQGPSALVHDTSYVGDQREHVASFRAGLNGNEVGMFGRHGGRPDTESLEARGLN